MEEDPGKERVEGWQCSHFVSGNEPITRHRVMPEDIRRNRGHIEDSGKNLVPLLRSRHGGVAGEDVILLQETMRFR